MSPNDSITNWGETFVIPEARITENTQYIPGIDGQKMSKSKNNLINVFAPEKQLRKQVMRIQTDSTPIEAPKDPESCTVFALFQLIASPEEAAALRQQYTTGGMGYGHAKQQLFEALCERFRSERERFDYYMSHPEEIEIALAKEPPEHAKWPMKYYWTRKKLGY